MDRAPATPTENREDSSHYFTPAGAKVRGAVEFCDRMGIEYFKGDKRWRFLSDMVGEALNLGRTLVIRKITGNFHVKYI